MSNLELHTQTALKLVAVVTAGAGSVQALDIFNQFVAMPVWGIPVTTFGASTAGSALSLFFGEPIADRRSLWGQVIASSIFGAATAVLVAEGFELSWAKANMSLFALMCSAVLRWFLPSLIERAKIIIRDLKFNSKLFKTDDKGEEK